MYQKCVAVCNPATNWPLVSWSLAIQDFVVADICQWQKFIMYKNETQKINMEDTLLIMKQINVLNNYRYFLQRLFTPRRYENYRIKGKYGGDWKIGKLVHYMPCDMLCTLNTKVDWTINVYLQIPWKFTKILLKVLAEMLRNHTVTTATYIRYHHQWQQQGI